MVNVLWYAMKLQGALWYVQSLRGWLLAILLCSCTPFSNTLNGQHRFPSVPAALQASLPAECAASSNPYVYDNQTLYAYLNGGADLFLKHGFQFLHGTVCKTATDQSVWLSVDVYDLGSEQNARALFQKKCSATELASEGTFLACNGTGYVQAQSGKYYIEVQSLNHQEDLLPLLQEIMVRVQKNLKGVIRAKK